MLAEMVESAIHHVWPREEGIGYVVHNHSWDQRVETYQQVIRNRLGST
jgi:hypothetical protein